MYLLPWLVRGLPQQQPAHHEIYGVKNRIKQLYAISINASPNKTINIRSGKILHLWREDIHASTYIPT